MRSFATSLFIQRHGIGWPWAQASLRLKDVLFEFSEMSLQGKAHLGEASLSSSVVTFTMSTAICEFV